MNRKIEIEINEDGNIVYRGWEIRPYPSESLGPSGTKAQKDFGPRREDIKMAVHRSLAELIALLDKLEDET